MLGNQKPDAARNIRPDENYAREFLQLFTSASCELNPDGTPRGRRRPAAARRSTRRSSRASRNVFTGWKWACAEDSPSGCDFDRTRPTPGTRCVPMQAFHGQQRGTGNGCSTTPGRSEYPACRSGGRAGSRRALDNIFFHPNVGPFIARQLIQKLVASNPSPDYVARVSAVFDDDGSGHRGNLAAVIVRSCSTRKRAPSRRARRQARPWRAPAAAHAALARL